MCDWCFHLTANPTAQGQKLETSFMHCNFQPSSMGKWTSLNPWAPPPSLQQPFRSLHAPPTQNATYDGWPVRLRLSPPMKERVVHSLVSGEGKRVGKADLNGTHTLCRFLGGDIQFYLKLKPVLVTMIMAKSKEWWLASHFSSFNIKIEVQAQHCTDLVWSSTKPNFQSRISESATPASVALCGELQSWSWGPVIVDGEGAIPPPAFRAATGFLAVKEGLSCVFSAKQNWVGPSKT